MTVEANSNDVKEQEIINSAEATKVQEEKKVSEAPVGSKEYNWRKMEQKNEQLEKEIHELRNALKENMQNSQKQEPADELSMLQEDDLITVGQMNKLAEKRAKKIIEEEFAKREKAKLPDITKSQFTDYDQVVTAENIEQLIKEDPDLEYDIQVAKNPYARAYKAIKQSQFYRDKYRNKENEDKIAENSKKPISINTIGKQRPLSHANEYAKGSPDLFKEIQQYRGGSL